MRKPWLLLLLIASSLYAQDPPKQEGPKQEQPEVKVNILNVCTPSDSEQQEISAALGKVPAKPAFTADFEISRGRTSMEDAGNVRYVRLRREMDPKTGFSTAQYSLSADPESTVETLVLHLHEPKDLLMISLEDQVTTPAASPSTVLDADTPVSRIKLERFGKSSLVLARCPTVDQAAYEPLFQDASRLLAVYRKTLGLRGMFRGDLAFLTQPAKKKSLAENAEAVKSKQ